MNLGPSGYEPDELPGCSTPRHHRVSRASRTAYGAAAADSCIVIGTVAAGGAHGPVSEDLAASYSPAP